VDEFHRHRSAGGTSKEVDMIQDRAQFAETVERLNQLALTCRQQGRHSEAVKYYRQALAAVEGALGPGDVNVATMLNNIAAVHNEQGRHDIAATDNERALAIRVQALGREHPLVAGDLTDLAHTRLFQRRYDDAESLLREALAINAKVDREHEVLLLEWLLKVGAVLHQHRRLTLTRTFLERALAIAQRNLPAGHDAIVQIRKLLTEADAELRRVR
jgi:tetratricopeptide (TPR) repeat protein